MGKRHLHTYTRIQTGMGLLWKCNDPNCNHHMPKHLEATMIGRGSICGVCGNQFRITPKDIESEVPGSIMTCPECKFDKPVEDLIAELGKRNIK